MFNTPILFIIFNRPDTTKEVFKKIAQIKPKTLYIAADGPRENNKSDIELCRQARDVVANINWECKVYKRFNEENLGCGINVSSAITWAFENEDRLIILEDDTLPALPFFYFCEELLEKYKDYSRIMHIAGTNLNDDFRWGEESYYFSLFAPIWGWATWKRAWIHYDYYLQEYHEFKKKEYYKFIFSNKNEQEWFINRYDSFVSTNYIKKQYSNWDYQWVFTLWKMEGLSIIPRKNLITNIGYIGTHSSKFDKKLFYRPADDSFKISIHPKFIIRNIFYDKINIKRFHRELSLPKKIIYKIKKSIFIGI